LTYSFDALDARLGCFNSWTLGGLNAWMLLILLMIFSLLTLLRQRCYAFMLCFGCFWRFRSLDAFDDFTMRLDVLDTFDALTLYFDTMLECSALMIWTLYFGRFNTSTL
jgi:hypothetical protein